MTVINNTESNTDSPPKDSTMDQPQLPLMLDLSADAINSAPRVEKIATDAGAIAPPAPPPQRPAAIDVDPVTGQPKRSRRTGKILHKRGPKGPHSKPAAAVAISPEAAAAADAERQEKIEDQTDMALAMVTAGIERASVWLVGEEKGAINNPTEFSAAWRQWLLSFEIDNIPPWFQVAFVTVLHFAPLLATEAAQTKIANTVKTVTSKVVG